MAWMGWTLEMLPYFPSFTPFTREMSPRREFFEFAAVALALSGAKGG